ncbi:GNAT family N-acetyltransferase [Sphaerisporangium rubeum]|uniref:GNAT superfamily N-acetyltransferase n=1 Tax=Sphaerisporangium rubeum TaxID=321317 RepID=A0A7X0M5Y6_9ACTN|nr:GNAT superfamily N-acetyltransferase [Sphaerisporangium rubeum]
MNRRGAQTISDDTGRPVLGFVEGTRAGRPCADLATALGPGAEQAVLRQLPGWVVAGDEGLGRRLLAAGASPLRHAHSYSRDLRADPAPAWWAETGYGVVACDAVPAAEVFPAWRAAYRTPGHPDRREIGDTEALERELAPLLAGESYGALLPCGGLLLRHDRVVAGVLVGMLDGEPPQGGPWVLDVFRDPDPRYAGLGSVMLRRALALATMHGLPALGLAVTDGNPARRVYERLGFRHTGSWLSVIVPERDQAGSSQT